MTTLLEVPSQEALDCPHWLPGFLDREPEQCWCARCGQALPCEMCRDGAAAANRPRKETFSHV
jgi:hypothetical protein